MQKISEGLSELCDSLEIKHVVVIGDGAGANIVARLAVGFRLQEKLFVRIDCSR